MVTDQALIIGDAEGLIRGWNSLAVELFGHDEDAALGSSLDMIVPEPFRARHWLGYRRAWTDGIEDAPRVAMMPVLCADGVVRRFAGHLLPIRGPHGELAAIAGAYARPSDRDDGLFVMG